MQVPEIKTREGSRSERTDGAEEASRYFEAGSGVGGEEVTMGWVQRYRVRMKIRGLERRDGGLVVVCGGEGREIGESEFNGRRSG
jgi:hypothetical protein